MGVCVVENNDNKEFSNNIQTTKRPPIYKKHGIQAGQVRLKEFNFFIKIFLLKEEPSTALRLIFLMLSMVFILTSIFYTIYLVLTCIRFINNINKLEDRRNSILYAQKISN